MNESNAAISIDGLGFAYGDDVIFEGLSLEAPANQLTFVIGPNGCGKSTLAKLIVGQLKPGAGKISCLGFDLEHMGPGRRVELIGYLPTEVDVYIPFRVGDLVKIHQSILAGSEEQNQYGENFKRLTATVGIAFSKYRRLNELSSGERRKVFLCLALAREPSLMVLDEPDVHLDIDTATNLYLALEKLCQQGRGIFCISHDVNLALRFAQNIILVNRDHKIEYQGPIGKKLFTAMKKVYSFDFHIVKTSTRSFIVPK